MKIAIMALTGALTLTGAAQAADLMMDAPMEIVAASSAHDWNGFYAGVMGGYASGNIYYSNGTPAADVNLGIAGGLLGGTLGANGQWDMFVLGVEGDIAWANISGGPMAVGGGNTLAASIDWVGTARLRAGVAVDQALLYVTAGLAAGGVSSTGVSGLGTTSFASTQIGWTAGAGVEVAVTEDISVKAEYAYTDLGTVSDGTALTGGLGTAINIHPTFHTVKVGANFHF